MSLQQRTLSLTDPSDAEPARGWVEAIFRGFHEPRPTDEMVTAYVDHLRTDDARLTGMWLPEGAFGAGRVPVATIGTFDKTLNVGRGPVPVRMITDVTVSPAHRRQGVLRTLMTAELKDAIAQGLALAALTVSETGIYGRFGFGAATRKRRLEIDARRFALRPAAAELARSGRMEVLDPRGMWPHITEIFGRWHRDHLGSVAMPTAWRDHLTSVMNFDERGEQPAMQGAVHLDAAERPDGYLLWTTNAGGVSGTVAIQHLCGVTPAVELALWDFAAHIDLAEKLTVETGSLAWPLHLALVEEEVINTTKTDEHIWVRVLDVEAALAQRAWHADGDVVLEVADSLGHAAGRFAVRVGAGEASVNRAEGSGPAIRLDAETLGAIHLGGTGVQALADVGRVTGDADQIATFARMCDSPTPPFSLVSF